MTAPPRFTDDQVADVLDREPRAVYHPPSRPGAGDDSIELPDRSVLPNPTRAAEWTAGRRPRLRLVDVDDGGGR